MKLILWILLLTFVIAGSGIGISSQTRRGWAKTAQTIPDLSLPCLQGKSVNLRSRKGKARMLFLVRAKQRLSSELLIAARELDREDGGLGAEILFVTTDAIYRAWFEGRWAALSLPYPLLFDLGHRLDRGFRVRTFPQLLVFDTKGIFLHAIGPGEGLEPGRILAWARFASGKSTQGELRKILAKLESRQLLARRSALSLLLRAQGEAGRGEREKARLSARQALKIYPDSIPIKLGAARILVQIGSQGQAKGLAISVLSKRPEHRRAMTILGIALFKEGKTDEAQHLLESALPLTPDPRLAQCYLARIYERKGEIDAALRFYRLALDPEWRIQ